MYIQETHFWYNGHDEPGGNVGNGSQRIHSHSCTIGNNAIQNVHMYVNNFDIFVRVKGFRVENANECKVKMLKKK